jgi:nucleotide-binding universal stress UspA family protein
MFQRIVVPLDGTEFGDYALPYAAVVARHAGAAVDLLHVHLPQHRDPCLEAITPYRFEGVDLADRAYDREWLEREAAALEDQAQRMAREVGVPAYVAMRRGRVSTAVTQAVAERCADLVVMATHGGIAPDGSRLPSVADQVVRHQDRPVLLVRPSTSEGLPESEPAFSRIVVALDGSSFSEQILGPALDVARLFDARLTLLTVVSPTANVGIRNVGLDAAGLDERRQEAETYLQRLEGMVPDELPDPDIGVIASRHPAQAILEFAERDGADLIALATHGRGGVSRLLLGSTAAKVVRDMDRPVLLYRPVAEGPSASME